MNLSFWGKAGRGTRSTHGRRRLGVLSFFVGTVAMSLPGLAPEAQAVYGLWLDVQHINLVDAVPPSTGAVSALMGLRSLGLSGEVTVQQVFDYGRGIDPGFSPENEFDENMLAGTMNQFETASGYDYVVVTSSDFSEIAHVIAASMSRTIPGVEPSPAHAPALIPLLGRYDYWTVVMGVQADVDPYLNPETTIYAFWVEDSQIYCDPMSPVPTNPYYPLPGEFQAVYWPMANGPNAGSYVAVVHITDVPVGAQTLSWGTLKASYLNGRPLPGRVGQR